MPMMVAFTVAHVAVGSLAFGSALRVASLPQLARQRMATA
jgi:uncharacterized membrane protein